MTAARLEVGQTAPGFLLPDADGRPVGLTDLVASGRRVLLYIYPAAMTPGCTTETVEFQQALAPFRDAGIDVVGLSRDAPPKLRRFRESYGITFPLLSDESTETLAAWGAFGEKKNYGKVVRGVLRSTFVVEPDLTVSLARYNVRAKGHVSMIAGLVGVELPAAREN